MTTHGVEPEVSAEPLNSVPRILDLRSDELLHALHQVLSGSSAAGLSGNPRLDRVPIDDLSSLMERNEPFRRNVQDLYIDLFEQAPNQSKTEFFSLVAQFPIRGASPLVSQGFSDALEIFGGERHYWALSVEPDWDANSIPSVEALRWFEAMAANQVRNSLNYRWNALLAKANSPRVCLAAWAGHAVSDPMAAVGTMGVLLRKAVENPKQAKPFGVGSLIGSLLPYLEPSAPGIREAAEQIGRGRPDALQTGRLGTIITRALSIVRPEVREVWNPLLTGLLTAQPHSDLKIELIAPKAMSRYSANALAICSRYRSVNFSSSRAA